MKIGAIADDFTGASDVANTLAKAGARTLQYVGVPDAPAVADIDAAVISLKTRSIPPAEAVKQSLDACRWLVGNGAKQILFKICSTFDSTPEGNIGPVAEALLGEFAAPVALVCPAFPANGRTVYQGHLFVGDRLLSESGMQHHPLTPMTDPDIRRWLGRQTTLNVGHLALSDLLGEDAAAALEKQRAEGARLVVADAVSDDDLLALGRLARDQRLVVGGSGIAMGLPGNFGIKPESASATPFAGAKGPALVLSGSCSAATRAQVKRYREAGRPTLKIAAAAVMDGDAALSDAIHFVEKHWNDAPLVFSTDEPEAVAADQRRWGREALANHFDSFFSALAKAAVERGVRRVVSAGGETSGAVAAALGGTALRVGPEIAVGVPALLTLSEPAVAVALKSGNFGGADFFERAVRVLGGEE